MTESNQPPAGMIGALDRILRGGFTDSDRLVDGRIDLPIGMLIRLALVLGMAYGLMMGLYAVFAWEDLGEAGKQVLSSALKVPALFLLTLAITFPSLYVLSALARTRLGAADIARLLLVVLAVSMALLASLGPITVFFTLSTDSYPFMVLLNVLFFGVAGFVGLSFMYRSMSGMLLATEPEVVVAEAAGSDEESKAAKLAQQLEARPAGSGRVHLEALRTRRLFSAWCVLFSIVGSQMGWVLRPFIGSPYSPFEIFREREANFIQGVLQALGNLFG